MTTRTAGAAIGLVTACRNGSAWVAELLRSVQAQELGDFEHVVVDDGSTDGSAEVIAETIRDDPRQHLVRTTGIGTDPARRFGYAHLSESCKYVGFPDADDVLRPSYLSELVGFLDSHPSAGAVASSFDRCDHEAREIPTPAIERWEPATLGIPRLIPPYETRTPFTSIYCWAVIPEPVALFRRSTFDDLGGWEPNLPAWGQSIRLFGLVAMHSEFHLLDRRLYLYRTHPQQLSRVKEKDPQSRRAVYEWWDGHATSLDGERRAAFERARWFKAKRLEPYLGLRSSARLAKEQHYVQASRFAVGAFKRWASCSSRS